MEGVLFERLAENVVRERLAPRAVPLVDAADHLLARPLVDNNTHLAQRFGELVRRDTAGGVADAAASSLKSEY